MILRAIMIIGYIFFTVAFAWLAVRYYNRDDKVGAIIFLATAVFGVVLAIKKITDIIKIRKSNKQ
jgi:hypothetical protein